MHEALNSIEPPNPKPVSVHVDPPGARALRKRHPWVYGEALIKLSRSAQTGELAAVYDPKNRFLGLGLYDAGSVIRVRMLQFEKPAAIDESWFLEKLRQAAALRKEIQTGGTNGYRLVHGENDGFPGLVVDRYAGTYVIKLYSSAWFPWLAPFVRALSMFCEPERIVLRLSRSLQGGSPMLHDGMCLEGAPLKEPVVFTENGLLFEADVARGQKTGFFLDQRDNRARTERFCKGRSVLNLFAYSGGFSLYAARGGAKLIRSVDSNRPALDAALRNFELNRNDVNVGKAEHSVECGDAFEVLSHSAKRKEEFDVVVIDPPAFAHAQADRTAALKAYGRMTQMGVRVLKRGGCFITASCSSRVSAEEFSRTVLKAASVAGRRLRITEETGHAADHPVAFPEGAYLKCLFCKSEN